MTRNVALAVVLVVTLGERGAAVAQEDKAAKAEAAGQGVADRYKECLGFFSAKDEESFGKCFASSATVHFVDSGQPVARGPKQAVENQAKPMWSAFPDVKIEPQITLVNGGNLASIDLFIGTNSGSFMGAPASGKKVGLHMAHVLQIDPVKRTAKKVSVTMDFGTMMGQLGMSPAPHRPALSKGSESMVVIAKGDATEKANLATWKKNTVGWNKHDAAKVLGDYADDAVFHDIGTPTDTKGKSDIEKSMQGYWTAFPNMKGTYTSVWAAGDWIVAVGTVTGTNTAAAPELGIQEKTGKKVKMNTVELARFEDGKIKDHWIFYNGIAFAQQLGLVPPPPGAAPKKS